MIPYLDFGGTGQPLHFAHANGYPPACYLPLIDLLKAKYHVLAMFLRPLWPGQKPESIHDWRLFSDDLLELIARNLPDPILGVGHSLGAVVTLRAAIKAPQHFHALVLIDPVFLPPAFSLLWNAVRALRFEHLLHPYVTSTLYRRRDFNDLEIAFQGYRRHPVFRYFSEESLKAYVHGIVKPLGNGRYELCYSPEWETRIYYTSIWPDMDLWRGLNRLTMPLLIIRGAETNTFWASTARRVQRIHPSIQVVSVPQSTHLVPLERPREVALIILDFLKDIL